MNIIDLKRFTKTEEVVVLMASGQGKYKERVIEKNIDDGWYKVTIGNEIKVERRATLLEINEELEKHKTITGYSFGSDFIPVNFENLFSKGYGETVPVLFNKGEPWEAIRVAEINKRFIYVDVAFGFHRALVHLQKLFEAEQTLLNEKNISPEIRYMWLLLSLERDTWRHLAELEALKLSEREKKKRAEEFRLNFSERIKVVVEQAGGVFISATKQANNRYLVTWRSGRQTVKSVIKENLRVEHAGYCLSNFDKHHSLQSLINLSKVYREESGSLYLTRV
ncbi:MAG: hypothetical protein KJ941_03900 [Bacteroidetes bacterium]|nr:hypothetical protein [Bacteroidota bacterium]